MGKVRDQCSIRLYLIYFEVCALMISELSKIDCTVLNCIIDAVCEFGIPNSLIFAVRIGI